MPTIKELYDKGQRQFPMRGGGVSPVIKLYKDRFFIVENGHDTWSLIGHWDGLYGEKPFDLLPEPLPELETLKAKLAEIEKVCEPMIDKINSHEITWAKYPPCDETNMTARVHISDLRALTKAIKGTDDV